MNDLPEQTPEERKRFHIRLLERQIEDLSLLKTQGPRAWRESGFSEKELDRQIAEAKRVLTKLTT